MIKCGERECHKYNETEDNNCKRYVDIEIASRGQCRKMVKDAVADVPCNVGLKGRLITAAASLSLHKLSEFDDDYPQRFPKRVLREIEKHNDHLGDIARELMSIKDAL
jgi:hypothetical protein